MEDGSRHRTTERSSAAPRLGQAAAGRATLWGESAVLDPAPWLGQGLARHPPPELQDRLRCCCGARHARLEIRGLSDAPQGPAGGIYIFR